MFLLELVVLFLLLYIKATFNAHSLGWDNETVVSTDTYHGVFPTEISPGSSFDTSAEAVVYNVTFSMD